MVEIVFMVLFLIPAVLGIAEILHIFKSYFLKPKKDIISFKIIILTNNDPVNQFLYVAEQCLWQGDCFNLVVVHSLLSLENYIECEKIAKKYDICFCSVENLINSFNVIIDS